MYGEIIIPPAVASELAVGAAQGVDVPDLKATPWLRIVPVQSQALIPIITDLGAGEAEVIGLALENPGSQVILDDRLGRRVAALNKLTITGTVGVVLKAKQVGYLPAVKPISSPIIGIGIIFPHLNLSLPQRLSLAHSGLQMGVKSLHQQRGGLILDHPQTGDDAGRTGEDECPRQANQLIPLAQVPRLVSHALRTTRSVLCKSRLYISPTVSQPSENCELLTGEGARAMRELRGATGSNLPWAAKWRMPASTLPARTALSVAALPSSGSTPYTAAMVLASFPAKGSKPNPSCSAVREATSGLPRMSGAVNSRSVFSWMKGKTLALGKVVSNRSDGPTDRRLWQITGESLPNRWFGVCPAVDLQASD